MSVGATASSWQVESLGRGVFLFRWLKGFYLSVFVVGERGVTAIDPISDAAAAAYRAAIASVTDRPLVRIVYSHDHRDHICTLRAEDQELLAEHRGGRPAHAGVLRPAEEFAA